MTSKQKTPGTSHRTCTGCGGRFTTWQGDDETMCNPCIIASFGDEPDPTIQICGHPVAGGNCGLTPGHDDDHRPVHVVSA